MTTHKPGMDWNNLNLGDQVENEENEILTGQQKDYLTLEHGYIMKKSNGFIIQKLNSNNEKTEIFITRNELKAILYWLS